MSVIVGIPVDSDPEENRVPLTPSVAPSMRKLGIDVLMEKGAGERAGFPDHEFEEADVKFTASRAEVFSRADILPFLHRIDPSDLSHMKSGQIAIGLLNPYATRDQVTALASKGITSFALELLPRISRAQAMDALTSMATLAGYKAVLLASEKLKKIFPMTMTAAGMIPPARIFVIGAGVAGLQAIATAKRLGAVVLGYDVRPAVKEQVESLGVKFVEFALETGQTETSGGYAKDLGEEFYRRQREMMGKVLSESDGVITTAAIPGKKAPVLITTEMVHQMRPGSVIVDLAAESGGNCELTKPGETVAVNGVTIMGPRNLPSTLATNASQLFTRNIIAFLHNLIKDGRPHLNMEDQIIKESMLTHNGEIVHPGVRETM